MPSRASQVAGSMPPRSTDNENDRCSVGVHLATGFTKSSLFLLPDVLSSRTENQIEIHGSTKAPAEQQDDNTCNPNRDIYFAPSEHLLCTTAR